MTCNILLMGMTGVGKSSLLNYLAGEKLAEAGIPAGSGGLTRGIKKYSITIKNQECFVFDSEGYENSTDHIAYCNRLIEKIIFKSNTSIQNRCPVVVYCIGSNSCRVQDLDLKLMEKILRYGAQLVIAFTKSDTATDGELESMKTVIQEKFSQVKCLDFVPICSVKTRNCSESGKEELLDVIYKAWCSAIIKNIPKFLFNYAIITNRKKRTNTLKWIETYGLGPLLDYGYIVEEVNSRAYEDVKTIISIIEQKEKQLCEEMSFEYGSIYYGLAKEVKEKVALRIATIMSELQFVLESSAKKRKVNYPINFLKALAFTMVGKANALPYKLCLPYYEMDIIISNQLKEMQREIDSIL